MIISKEFNHEKRFWTETTYLPATGIDYFNLLEDGSIDAMNAAWGIFGSAFGPVVLLSLLWKRFTYRGALAGIVSGALVDIIWLIALSNATGIYEIIPGFIVGLITSIVFSLTDEASSEDIQKVFEKAVNSEDE